MIYELEDFGSLQKRGEFMRVLRIAFDLPFVLMLPDSLTDYNLEEWFADYKAGKENIKPYIYAPPLYGQKELDSVGGDVVYVPSREVIPGYGKAYRVPVDEIKANVTVALLKRVNPLNIPIVNMELYGDTSAKASFTSVEVLFHFYPFLNDDVDDLFYHTYANYAISAINKIIEHYRVLSRRYYINRVTIASVGRFRFFVGYVDDKDLSQHSLMGQTYLTNILDGIPDGGFTKLTELVPPHVDMTIRNFMKMNRNPPILKLLNAEVNSRYFYADLRLLIIESAVYFEEWINALLTAIYRSKFHMKEDEILDMFKIGRKVKFNKTQKADIEKYILDSTSKQYNLQDEFIRHMGVTEIVNELTTHAFEFEFKKTEEWNDFRTNVIELRNKIVHGYLDMQNMREDRGASEKVHNTLFSAMRKIAVESKNIAPHVKSAFFTLDV